MHFTTLKITAQKKHEEFGLKPYVAHATFQVSGS
jgi:hypothetical protein